MSPREKLQELLARLFRLDECFGLDFGVHRVVNLKRADMTRFLRDDLPGKISAILADSADSIGKLQLAEFVEARKKLVEVLGKDALTADGGLNNGKYHKAPIGKRYLAARAAVEGLKPAEKMEEEIYGFLVGFFDRYHCGGDLVPRRRHSESGRYAVPHNGEEVLLHWANRDQYYIKTAAAHAETTFKIGGRGFRLKIADARNTPRDNNKDSGRFFFPQIADAEKNDDGELVVPFALRALNADEKKQFANGEKNGGNGNGKNGAAVQRRILDAALADLQNAAKNNPDLRPLLAINDGGDEPAFARHARRFVRRNTSDFFIHRNLRKFLAEELDFYLKSEVLNAEELSALGAGAVVSRMIVFRAVRDIGRDIADFLAQWEDFQKSLWEKKKFVLATEYCATVGNIPNAEKDGLLDDIVKCEKQWDEWKALGMNGDAAALFSGGGKAQKRLAFLRENPALPVDTANFPPEFKDRLLAQFSDIDDATDGVLIHGENWQALNLIGEMYRGRVKCVYIDPPYNTDESKIIYKNDFEHSSWLSLMENRYDVLKRFIAQDTVIMTAIDDFEMVRLCMLSDQFFPMCARHVVVVNHHPQGAGMGNAVVSRTHEYMVVLTFPDTPPLKGGRIDENEERRAFRRAGRGANNFRGDFSNNFYAVLVAPTTREIVGLERPPEGDYPTDKTPEGHRRIYPIGEDGSERVWRFSYESGMREFRAGNLECTDRWAIRLKIDHGEDRRGALFTNWTNAKYNAGVHGENLLSDIMGFSGSFSYPKSLFTVRDAVEAATYNRKDAVVLDYFAGSGTTAHAVISLNREDGGRRKFILAEMGDHFNTVLLPRMKKVMFAPEWLDGKSSRRATAEEFARGPRLVKYQRIESYEDALANIRFEGDGLAVPDYAPRYMLEWESRGSRTFLDGAGLESPFSYPLALSGEAERLEHADLPETFAYLIGLRVRTRRVETDGERRYVVQQGVCDGRDTAVIWRDAAGWTDEDLREDLKFIRRKNLAGDAKRVLVNGGCLLPKAKPLAPIFKERMFPEKEKKKK